MRFKNDLAWLTLKNVKNNLQTYKSLFDLVKKDIAFQVITAKMLCPEKRFCLTKIYWYHVR